MVGSAGARAGQIGLCEFGATAVDFLAVHGDFRRGRDTEAHLVALDGRDDDADTAVDDDRLNASLGFEECGHLREIAVVQGQKRGLIIWALRIPAQGGKPDALADQPREHGASSHNVRIA